MTDTQREHQAGEDSTTGQTDESRTQASSALPVIRLLANPRRVRRL